MKNCKMFPVGRVLITGVPVLQDYLRFILIFWDASPSALRSSLRGPRKQLACTSAKRVYQSKWYCKPYGRHTLCEDLKDIKKIVGPRTQVCRVIVIVSYVCMCVCVQMKRGKVPVREGREHPRRLCNLHPSGEIPRRCSPRLSLYQLCFLLPA